MEEILRACSRPVNKKTEASLTLRIALMAPLCWFVSCTYRGSSSSSGIHYKYSSELKNCWHEKLFFFKSTKYLSVFNIDGKCIVGQKIKSSFKVEDMYFRWIYKCKLLIEGSIQRIPSRTGSSRRRQDLRDEYMSCFGPTGGAGC